MPQQAVAPRPLVSDSAQQAEWLRQRRLFAEADERGGTQHLADWARAIRRSVVAMIDHAQQGHIGGDFSAADILASLFLAVLNVRPDDPGWSERDRMIVSKGHSSASLYSALAFCGYFSPERLLEYMDPLSPLNGHPNRNKVPGVETNTGALGHGLPVAVGTAIGGQIAGRSFRTFVLTGDGELQEGSNWEALMTGAHYGLERLTLIVDRNHLQQGARTEETSSLDPLDAKLASFGWEVRETDGHDHRALLDAVSASSTGKPVAVIARTIKGRGVSFIEDRVEWHHHVPTADEVRAALAELV